MAKLVIEKSGVIKWFNNEKGFGIIESEESERFFVHYTDIFISKKKNSKILLVENQKVLFLESSDKHNENTKRAVNVQVDL